MGGSYMGHQRIRPSSGVEFAEPRTPTAAQHASPSRGSPSASTSFSTPRRPMTEYSLDRPVSPGNGGSDPRPILRHQSSNVRISSPLRKQVDFEDKPRMRPALKSCHSAGASPSTPDGKSSLRERRGRARAQVSWAQTIAVPPNSSEFLEELANVHGQPMNPRRTVRPAFPEERRSLDQMSYVSDARSFTGDARSLRTRSISSKSRNSVRPHSTASSNGGLWFEMPPPAPPHPSTCMPGFPAQEFGDQRPPTFSRERLARSGVIMPRPARPQTIAIVEQTPSPSTTPSKAAARQVRQPSISKGVSGFLSRRLTKRSTSHPPPASVSGPSAMADHPAQLQPILRDPREMYGPTRMPITPPGHHRTMSMGPSNTPPSCSPMGMPMDPHGQYYVQWPEQSIQPRFRGGALPPGAGHILPPGAAHAGSPNALPPGALPSRPGVMQGHAMMMPPQHIQPPPHVLSPQEAARQALRHYRSQPAMRVTSPEMGLPTQWVERVPPPPSDSYFEVDLSEEEEEELVVRPPDFAHPPVHDAPAAHLDMPRAPMLSSEPKAPHLSVDFGSGDLWTDLERTFGGLSLPDLPGPEDLEDAGSDDSHTTHATTTTRATHTTMTATHHAMTTITHADVFSDGGHSITSEPPRMSSDMGHASPRPRVTMSDVGHSAGAQAHRRVLSEAGYGPILYEHMASPPTSPVRHHTAGHRAASESECDPMVHWSPHKLSTSAPGTPMLGARVLRGPTRSPNSDSMVSVSPGGFRPPPRGESLVASSLGATSNRPMFSPSPSHLNTPPRRTSSRSPSSMSLRSSMSMHSESSNVTISSLPSTMTSMTTASSAASVEMPDPIGEEDDEHEEMALDVFGIVPGQKYIESHSPRPHRGETPCRQVQLSTPEMDSARSTPDSIAGVEIRRVQRARSTVARVRSIVVP